MMDQDQDPEGAQEPTEAHLEQICFHKNVVSISRSKEFENDRSEIRKNNSRCSMQTSAIIKNVNDASKAESNEHEIENVYLHRKQEDEQRVNHDVNALPNIQKIEDIHLND
ncbi:MAG: hypothetical protein Crog4KO_17800 [Crocinitomicaceae bacterium]